MKGIFKTLLFLTVLLAILTVLSSCGEHVHTPMEAVSENAVAATCVSAGSYDEVVYCSGCNQEISRLQKTVDKLPHSEIETIAINGGKNKGLINIEDLTDKLNALVDWCENHTHSGVITAVSGGSGAPAVGTPGNTGKPITAPNTFNQSDYEDDKITH